MATLAAREGQQADASMAAPAEDGAASIGVAATAAAGAADKAKGASSDGATSEVDGWIAKLMDCKHLTEAEVKRLQAEVARLSGSGRGR